MQHWFFLAAAIAFEVMGTTSMKLSQGFTKLIPSIAVGVCFIISFSLFTIALKKIDMGLAYAIWAGAGTALVAAIGIFYFKEPATTLKMVSIALIIAGVVGLNLSGAKH